MKTIVGYNIARSENSDWLCLQVYGLLEKGYVPLGAPYVQGDTHFQAMVKYGDSTYEMSHGDK